MKAIELMETGGPEVMHLRQIPTPTPRQDEVLIRVAVTGVNFIDLYVREGRYGNELPFTPGQEAAGTVVAVGKGVSHVHEGDRVAWCSILGTYAEYAVVPAERVVPIPIGVTFEQAAAALLQGMTAHYLSHSAYPIQPGDEVLIHAGAGGTGLPPLDLMKLASLGSLYVTRPILRDYTLTRNELVDRATQVFQPVVSGSLKLRIERTYSLSEAAQAHRDLESRKTAGKLLLLP
jgi:NADPH:quinone reductase-like Zn-dependent oxidoreductase